VRSIHVLPRAVTDIDESVDYYVGEAGFDVALRFLDAVEGAFSLLRRHPEAGAIARYERVELEGIRRWPVREFDAHLVFYRLVDDRIEVVRVLHGAQDLEQILSIET